MNVRTSERSFGPVEPVSPLGTPVGHASGLDARVQEGYTLAFLMVVVTIMNVAVAMALPSWTNFVQREKEAELIFRGLQYAEAIRVFQKVNNRLPISLEELYEKEPRSIRQLYPDPMNENGKWGLLVQSAAPRPVNNPQQGQQANPDERPVRGVGVPNSGGFSSDSGATDGQQAANPAAGNRGGGGVVAVPPAKSEEGAFGEPIQRTTGPIVGVYSAADGKAMRKFMNSESYSQWQFKADLIPVPAILGGDQPAPRVTSEWIGKPFRDDIQVQQGARGAGARPGGLVDGKGPGEGSLNPGSFRPRGRDNR